MKLFLNRFLKNTPTSNFIKTRPMGSQLFYTDEQKDRRRHMLKLIVALCNSAKAHKHDCTIKIKSSGFFAKMNNSGFPLLFSFKFLLSSFTGM
jgi:hypothetical protein